MKLIPIFVVEDREVGIWSIQLDNKSRSEFEEFFDLVNDIEWLRRFFIQNSSDLQDRFFRGITIEAAVLKTLDEAEEMEDLLYRYAEEALEGSGRHLQQLFKPLNNYEYALVAHQKSKARIRQGWLRLYAIRFAPNCYLVTGGAIKLAYSMTSGHLQTELRKLDLAKQYLRNNGIDYPEDLNNYKNE